MAILLALILKVWILFLIARFVVSAAKEVTMTTGQTKELFSKSYLKTLS